MSKRAGLHCLNVLILWILIVLLYFMVGLELLCITKAGEFVMMVNDTDLEACSPKLEFNWWIKTYCHCVVVAAYVESLVSSRAAITNKSQQQQMNT